MRMRRDTLALTGYRKLGDNMLALEFEDDEASHLIFARIENTWYKFTLDLSAEKRCVTSRLMVHHFVPPIYCLLPSSKNYSQYRRFERLLLYHRNHIIAELYWPDVNGQYNSAGEDIVVRDSDTIERYGVGNYVGRKTVRIIERIPRYWNILSVEPAGEEFASIIENLLKLNVDDRVSKNGVKQGYLWGDRRLQRSPDIV
jgi:hypothetical protein